MSANNLKLFRTTQGTAEYRERYESTLDLWHPRAQPLTVGTRFGATRVNAAGSPDLPPLVLIHGFGFSSTQWYPNVPALSPHFRIYAPDVPDQFGMSVLSQAIQTRENYALWLGDLLDNLGISQTALAGHSYGGWMATNYTLSQPERVTRLALIAPAGTFVPLSAQFFLRGIAGGSLAGALNLDFPVYSMVRWMTTLRPVEGLEIVEQFKVGMKNMAPVPAGMPGVFTSDEFARLNLPVLLLLGEREVIYSKSPKNVLAEGMRLLPGLQTILIPNGGHALTLDQVEATNQALCDFFLAPKISF
jgi:pimeloyl-ACP methyl ester carboxylesterase